MELYLVTDRKWLNGSELSEKVEEAIKNGVTFVQLREKDLSYDEFIKEARKVKKVTDKYKIPFVINDNIDVMLAVDADGVHVGQKDMSVSRVREIIGDKKIIGATVKTIEQAKIAEEQGANYLGVGAVFGSTTKLDTSKISLDTLKQIADSVSIPVIAIGGINENNILDLKDRNIKGVAVISAILEKTDIAKATKNLRNLVEKII